ncbi:MAG: thiamine-phosphate kinase [Acidimicrobiales bacterium]
MDATGGGEFAAIDRIRRLLPPAPAGETWSGDDAAVVLPSASGAALLLTTDAVVAGVHADLDLVGLDDFGWKAVAAAVSDVAAMGGAARWLLAAVCGPPDTDLDRLASGMVEAAAAHSCPLVGGDLSRADQLVVTVTVVGEVAGPGPPAVRRAGARAGDWVLVTGPLGASAAGLRLLRAAAAAGRGVAGPCADAHRRPRARLAEGRQVRLAGAGAMIDVSDGLSADLGHLASASGVGLRLDDVPVADGATFEEALGGGEDYELAFTAVDPTAVVAAFAAAGLRRPLVIGLCTDDPAVRTLAGQPLVTAGWEHRWR